MQLFASLLFIASVSYAHNAQQGEYNFVCQSVDQTKTITQVELKQLKSGIVYEGEKHLFELKISNLNPRTKQVMSQSVIYRGLLETEDVQLFFNSFDKKVNLDMYLDEDESHLTIRGQKRIRLSCAHPDFK